MKNVNMRTSRPIPAQRTQRGAALVVGMLLLLVLTLLLRSRGAQRDATSTSRPALLPWFLVVFAGLIVLNSVVALPAAPRSALLQLAQFCLITAVAAIGIRTSLKDMASLGPRAVWLLVGETLFLAALSIGLLLLV